MVHKKVFRTAALLLVLEVILMIVPFLILQSVFEFPDILRKPASEVFELYRSQQSIITPAYYFFMLSGLLLIPLAIAMHHAMQSSSESNRLLLAISTGFGIGAGIAQIFGFIRWPFLMPYLAETYASSTTTPAAKEAVVVVYESFNRYAGMAIGEHLGWVLLGLWLIGVSLVQLKSAIVKSWVGILGLLSGAGLLVSAFEQLSGSLASALASLNIVANYLLLGWLLGTAAFLFIHRKGH
ncbi:DUF4386 family protein [Cohnella sp. GCM10027633]|uniref:DUF4386 family protein n=1 Tax=unclassified Cohnella TaxID=2636738 RepID=UPI0036275651